MAGRVMAMQLAGLPKDNPTFQRYQAKIYQVLDLVDKRLGEVPWLAGNELTVADIMIIFSLTTMREVCPLNSYIPVHWKGSADVVFCCSSSHSTCQNTKTSSPTHRKSSRGPRTRAISRRQTQTLRLRNMSKGRRRRCIRLLRGTNEHMVPQYAYRDFEKSRIKRITDLQFFFFFFFYPIFVLTCSPLPHLPNSSTCSAYHRSNVAEFT